MRDYQTTRLKSTAGAGVGSILMDEATILNPAPLAFYNIGSVYFNKGNSESIINGNQMNDAGDMGVIVSDSKSSTAGSASYLTQTYGNRTRKRISVAMSSALQKESAFGVSIRKTIDEVKGGSKDEYFQTVFGITHIISPKFTLGFVAVDPLKERVNESKGTIGVQYLYEDFISVMLDAGANYYEELRKTFVYKSAVQFKLLDDFYARFGYFRDLGMKESGTGVGLGWVQPKLVLEAALKNTQTFSDDRVSETSFSLSYRF